MADKFGTVFVGAMIYSLKTIVCDVRLPICSSDLPVDVALSNGVGITSDVITTWYTNVRHELIDIELTVKLIAAVTEGWTQRGS